jgi:predicted CXXCH cytochrome family protein
MEKETAHQPAARDCERCHQPHVAAQESLLSQAIQPTCLQCHSPERPEFGKAHLNIEATAIDCRSCHDPHASKDQKFFKANVHMPFGSRACDDCHVQ